MSTDRLSLLTRFGSDPIACSTLQDGLRFFEGDEGYVAYQRAFGVALSLGPPVGADQRALAGRYLDEVPRAALFYVSQSLAQSLPGFRAPMGHDRVLDLRDEATFAGDQVRSATRKATRAGFRVDELHLETASDEDRAWLKSVTDEALSRSVTPHEMRFLNRPMHYAPSGPQRVFALSLRNQRFGYAVIDPYFENGAVKGYLLNLLRFTRTSLWGVYLATVEALSRELLSEGVGELSLGFCPLSQLDLSTASAILRPELRYLEKTCARSDYFTRLFAMKSQFAGRWQPRFLVSTVPLLTPHVLALISLMGVPVREVFAEKLGTWWQSRVAAPALLAT